MEYVSHTMLHSSRAAPSSCRTFTNRKGEDAYETPAHMFKPFFIRWQWCFQRQHLSCKHGVFSQPKHIQLLLNTNLKYISHIPINPGRTQSPTRPNYLRHSPTKRNQTQLPQLVQITCITHRQNTVKLSCPHSSK